MTSTRERLTNVAFRLFAQQGFEQTNVEQVAREAGVSRATFFRNFPSKEAVIFPDHDSLLSAVDARLSTAETSTAAVALHEAIQLVLRHYLAEGETARTRFALTRTVPVLRQSELASGLRYERLIRDHLRRWQGHGSVTAFARMKPELVANALVTVHNHVLRDWLRHDDDAPEASLELGIREVVARLWANPPEESPQVVVLRTNRDLGQALAKIRELLAEDPGQ